MVSREAKTIEDYLGIQLAVDLVASCFRLVSVIFMDIVPNAFDYTWDTFIKQYESFSEEALLKAVSGNVVSLAEILLSSVSDADLVSSRIEGFASLTTIVEELT